ncbi:MAG: hypothetical protein RJB38_1568 [Pseudomonadota bacterium]|jgi:hypothetical protein
MLIPLSPMDDYFLSPREEVSRAPLQKRETKLRIFEKKSLNTSNQRPWGIRPEPDFSSL